MSYDLNFTASSPCPSPIHSLPKVSSQGLILGATALYSSMSSSSSKSATTEKTQNTVLKQILATGLGATCALVSFNPTHRVEASFTHISLCIMVAKLALNFFKERYKALSETECQNLQTLFTGSLVGVTLTALEASTNPLSEIEKTILSLAMVGTALITTIGIEHSESWNYFDLPGEAEETDYKEFNIQEFSDLPTKTAGTAFMVNRSLALTSNPIEVILGVTTIALMSALWQKHSKITA